MGFCSDEFQEIFHKTFAFFCKISHSRKNRSGLPTQVYIKGLKIMDALQGYTENGRVIPVGNKPLPDGLKVIITILDDIPTKNRAHEQKKALEAFREDLNACEPLPPEFNEIVSKRVNIPNIRKRQIVRHLYSEVIKSIECLQPELPEGGIF
jgi:hypothetical protein